MVGFVHFSNFLIPSEKYYNSQSCWITLYQIHDSKVNEDSGEELPESTLQLVQIYFDTATYDEVERDKKIKTEAQLSLIGGTMGLLTGFSIISGVEIIFYLLRLIWSSI